MATYTLNIVDPVVTPDGSVLYEFNGLLANGGSLAVGDKIVTPKVKSPRGCKRVVFIKATDTSNADTCSLSGYISGVSFILPSINQASAGAYPNYTSAAANHVSLQGPNMAPDVEAYVTLATSVPTKLQMILAFLP